MLLHRKAAQIKRIHKKSKYFSGVSFGKTQLFALCHLRSEENAGAKRPRRPLWGVAERSESFKIMIAGGNHTPAKSCQPEWADLSARRRYASEQPP